MFHEADIVRHDRALLGNVSETCYKLKLLFLIKFRPCSRRLILHTRLKVADSAHFGWVWLVLHSLVGFVNLDWLCISGLEKGGNAVLNYFEPWRTSKLFLPRFSHLFMATVVRKPFSKTYLRKRIKHVIRVLSPSFPTRSIHAPPAVRVIKDRSDPISQYTTHTKNAIR